MAGLAVLATLLAPGPADAGSAPETLITAISEPTDRIGNGLDRFFHPDNSRISIMGSADQVTLTASGGNEGDEFRFQFAAPFGEDLAIGSYDGVDEYRSREQPGLNISRRGTGGCINVRGRFEVKHIETDADGAVTSLWVVYEQHCEISKAALVGEVRYRAPGDGGSVMVGPRDIWWTDAELGEATVAYPVTLVNPTGGTVSMGAASTLGDDADLFPISADGCRGVALGPGSSCQIWVRHMPDRVGMNRAELSIPEHGGTVHEVALRGRVFGGTTRLILQGAQGEWVTQSGRYSYDPPTARMFVTTTYRGISANVLGVDGNHWYVVLEAAPRDDLTPATRYEPITRRHNTLPAMEVTGTIDGTKRTCEPTGWFRVRDVSFDPYGEVERFGARFEYRCKGASLFGVLDYRMPSPTSWPDPGPVEPLPSPTATPTPTATPSPTPGSSPSPTPVAEPPPIIRLRDSDGLETDFSIAGGKQAWSYAPPRAIRKPRVMFKASSSRKVSMHGSKLVYQQRRRARSVNSQIRLYNTRKNKHRGLPDNVNSREFEWAPVVHGRWLAFTRVVTLASGQDRSMLSLVNLKTGKKEIVESRQDTGNSIRAGQMSGRHLTWERCTHQCEVLTYDRSTSRKVWMPKPRNGTLPNSDLQHYAPSVLRDGTTFYARSLEGCGNEVSLYMRPEGGPNELLFDLPPRTDLDGTWAVARPDGGVRLYLDLIRCRSNDYGIHYVDLPAD